MAPEDGGAAAAAPPQQQQGQRPYPLNYTRWARPLPENAVRLVVVPIAESPFAADAQRVGDAAARKHAPDRAAVRGARCAARRGAARGTRPTPRRRSPRAQVSDSVARLLPPGTQFFANAPGDYHVTLFHLSHLYDPRPDTASAVAAAAALKAPPHARPTVRRRKRRPAPRACAR